MVRVIVMFQKNECWGNRDSTISYFETSHTHSLTSIDRLVTSETYYKRNSSLILVRELQENFKLALCGAIQNGSFQSNH